MCTPCACVYAVRVCPPCSPSHLSPHTPPFPLCLHSMNGQGFKFVRDVYRYSNITDQTSVPILFDKETQQVVSNESSEIVRMLAQHAAELGGTNALDLYHEDDRQQIDDLNELVYHSINNGAYKAGFSSSQEVYETAYDQYFQTLDELEKQLSESGPWLCGNRISEADIRLFPTLYRHDPVYFTRMKLNKALLKYDYPSLWAWLCRMYAFPGVAESSRLSHCKQVRAPFRAPTCSSPLPPFAHTCMWQGYFGNSWNKTVPKGPVGYPECYEEGAKQFT